VYFMNEKEALIQAKKNLKSSIQVVRRDLKIYNKAILNRNKAILKNVGNDVIGLFTRLSEKSNIYRLEKEKERLEKKQAKIEEQIKEANLRIQKQEEIERIKAENKQKKQLLKEEKKEQRHERFLNFKNGIKQKTTSVKSRFGKIKNSILDNLSLTNINAKLRSAFDSVQLFGIKAANEVVKGANTMKDSVSNFTSDQIAKYYLNKIKRDEIREEKRREKDIERAEKKELVNEMERIKERTRDHKIGMMEAFAERDGNDSVQDEIAKNVQKIIEEKNEKGDNNSNNLNLNPNKKQKVKSSKSRLGRVKNSVLNGLRLTNLDSKIRNAFDNIQLFGINVAEKTVKGANKAKEGISKFTSDQIARYSEWRINRLAEKEYEARRQAEEDMVMVEYLEKLNKEEKELAQRTKDHKIGMVEALNKQEREHYDAKHEEFLRQRQELIQSLTQEKNKLFGIQMADAELKPRSR